MELYAAPYRHPLDKHFSTSQMSKIPTPNEVGACFVTRYPDYRLRYYKMQREQEITVTRRGTKSRILTILTITGILISSVR
jgi:hypothetical protein